jgi:hypothetical protein
MPGLSLDVVTSPMVTNCPAVLVVVMTTGALDLIVDLLPVVVAGRV